MARARKGHPALVLLVFALLAAAVPALPSPAAAAPAGWRDTGISLPGVGGGRIESGLCVDPTRPHLIVVPGEGGTESYDWSAGPASRRRVNDAAPRFCNRANGFIYGELAGRSVRFSLAAPTPVPIAHLPTHLSEDSSLWAYALGAGGALHASPDGGLTWQETPIIPAGPVLSLTLATADARVLYAAVELARPDPDTLRYAVVRSTDAGATWETRSVGETSGFGEYGGPRVTVSRIAGRSAPVDLLALILDPGYPGSSNTRTVRLSPDGGASFRPLASEKGDSSILSLFHANGGIVMRYFTSFVISRDRGATWQPLPQPFDFNSYAGHTAPVNIAHAAPANLFAAGDGRLFWSPDDGQGWRAIGDAPESFLPTPYAPLALLGLFGDRLHVLALPEADRSQTRATVATDAPGGTYATPTGHNLPERFRAYWEAHGGLAQFGYPLTEPFREVSPTDGNVYLVQYFERNRFEYHPEHAGTPHEILLGLLGNDLTAERRAGGGPFARVADPGIAGQIYFPETGHTLRNAFKAYWEAHGGLELYGFPLSEEFAEANPDDGRAYIVQYFERNRFEWHPGNAPPYDVLLGLLGNTLLEQKGWR